MKEESARKWMIRYLNKRERFLRAELQDVLKLKCQLKSNVFKPTTRQPEVDPVAISQGNMDWELEVIKIMKAYQKPMTKAMVMAELDKKFLFYRHFAKEKLSSLFVSSKNKKFKRAQRGWWELNKDLK